MNNEEEKTFDNDEENIDTTGEVMEWVKSIAIAVVIAVFIKTFIFNTTYVLGSSMHPTLQEKDRLFASKISLYTSGPKRGDIILLDAPDVANKKYIKRVIGVAGDTVEIIDGLVYLNGDRLEEDYIEEGSYTHVYNEYSWYVEEGEVFVLGDNRVQGASKDSRYFGCISNDTVKGVTKFRYFPFGSSFGKVE